MKNKTGIDALELLRRGFTSGVFDDAPVYKADVLKLLHPMREDVTVNVRQELYVIPTIEGGYSCLGFDVADKWARAACAEMNRPELMPQNKPGTLEHYKENATIMDVAYGFNGLTGHRFAYALTPQLVGLENKRVEVVDRYGEKRRFYVGKSSGFIPCHLEIAKRNSTGGPAVMGAPFKSVKVVGER